MTKRRIDEESEYESDFVENEEYVDKEEPTRHKRRKRSAQLVNYYESSDSESDFSEEEDESSDDETGDESGDDDPDPEIDRREWIRQRWIQEEGKEYTRNSWRLGDGVQVLIDFHERWGSIPKDTDDDQWYDADANETYDWIARKRTSMNRQGILSLPDVDFARLQAIPGFFYSDCSHMYVHYKEWKIYTENLNRFPTFQELMGKIHLHLWFAMVRADHWPWKRQTDIDKFRRELEQLAFNPLQMQ
jgi:hypothetical protein